MLTVDPSVLGVKKGEHILDVGCGTGRHSWGIYAQVDCFVYALDVGEEDLIKTGYTLRLINQENERGRRLQILLPVFPQTLPARSIPLSILLPYRVEGEVFHACLATNPAKRLAGNKPGSEKACHAAQEAIGRGKFQLAGTGLAMQRRSGITYGFYFTRIVA